MDHNRSDESLETPVEGDYSGYRHRRLSMHRNVTARAHKRGSTSPEDYNNPIYLNDQEHTLHHVDQIVDKICTEEESLLGEGVMSGLEFRQTTLRNMPQSLKMKKLVKEKLNLRGKRGTQISGWKMIKFNMIWSFKKFKEKLQDFFTFELWNGTMKKIDGEYGSATGIFFRFFRHLFLLNCLTFLLCFLFILVPKIIEIHLSEHQESEKRTDFKVLDLFTGQGYFESSAMFYGCYKNTSITVNKYFSYSMPRAYFYTMILLYITLLFTLAISMMRSYKTNFIETKGGLKNVFAHKVFCTWDFGTATEGAARLKSSAIFHELKELLEEELRPQRTTSCKSQFFTFMMRLTAHLLTLGLMGASGYSIWLLLDWHWVQNHSEWSGIITAVVLNAVIYLVPVLFSLMSRYEDYENPRKAFNITLLRTFVLHAAVIFALVGFWLFRANKITGCWETKLGQEVYRLLIVEFIFSIAFFASEKLLLYIGAMCTGSEMDFPEFEVAEHTVHLICNQALFWLGLMFAPLLGALIVVKYWIMWYFTTLIEIKCSKPSTKFWRATNTHTWFLVITFLSILFVMIGLGCIMALVFASSCGPFGSSPGERRYIYDFLKDEILRLERGSALWHILSYLFKPGVVAVVIILMIGFIYYLRARALAQETMVSVLQEMIVLKSKDKKYLLQHLRMVANEWKFSSSNADPLHTPIDKLHKQEKSRHEYEEYQDPSSHHAERSTTTSFIVNARI